MAEYGGWVTLGDSSPKPPEICPWMSEEGRKAEIPAGWSECRAHAGPRKVKGRRMAKIKAAGDAIIWRAGTLGERAFSVAPREPNRVSNIFREFVEAVVLALVVFVAIQTSVQNFKVEGSSMHPTLDSGQYLLVNKLVYFQVDPERWSRMVPFWKVDQSEQAFAAHGPERGEVVVFHFPKDHTRDFVKRVIGVPGDRVEIERGTVLVNGAALDEPLHYGPRHLGDGAVVPG